MALLPDILQARRALKLIFLNLMPELVTVEQCLHLEARSHGKSLAQFSKHYVCMFSPIFEQCLHLEARSHGECLAHIFQTLFLYVFTNI